jgi:hypothetical protein
MKTIMHPALIDYREVVRVAVSTNFNCTPAEFRQLDGFTAAYPDRFFFVNCNVNTPDLLALNDHQYKSVITANPNLTVSEKELTRLYKVSKERVAFVRVKYLPDNAPIVNLIRELSEEGYDVVITNQRFNGKQSLLKYTSLEHYQFSCSRYRLQGEALSKMLTLADSLPNVHVCDRQGLGCSACGKCASLTLGKDIRLTSLNLSSSGLCKHSCPDCYAKTMQKFLERVGAPLVRYDKIIRNSKQSGRTAHIQHAKTHV